MGLIIFISIVVAIIDIVFIVPIFTSVINTIRCHDNFINTIKVKYLKIFNAIFHPALIIILPILIICSICSTISNSGVIVKIGSFFEANEFTAATLTPQHLMFNRNHMLVGGVRPHLFCLPILKRNVHQEALRAAVASGCERFFLGTDTAPHIQSRKESSCGCAGVFNAPTALAAYASVFEELGALAHFEAFCSLNGPKFYNLPVNEGTITLTKEQNIICESIDCCNDKLVPFLAGEDARWTISLGQ